MANKQHTVLTKLVQGQIEEKKIITHIHYPPRAVPEGLSLQWEKVHFMWVSEPVQTLNFSCTKFNTTYTQSTSTQMIQVRRMLQTSNLTGQTQFNLTHGLSQIRYTGLECLSHWILNGRDWVWYIHEKSDVWTGSLKYLASKDQLRTLICLCLQLETDLHILHDLPRAQKGLVVCKAKVLRSFHWSSSGNRSHDLSSCNQAFYWLS